MAETRCPMCGKPNPGDRGECQHCGARLVPLIIKPRPEEEGTAPPAEVTPSEEGSPPPAEADQEELSSDWLSELRGEEEENPPQPPLIRGVQEPPLGRGEKNPPQPPLERGEQEQEAGEAGSEESPEDKPWGVTDWLSRLEDRSQEAGGPELEETFSEPERKGVTDWLSRLENPPQPPLERGEQEQEAGEAGTEDAAEELDWTAGEILENAEVPDWQHEAQAEPGDASEDQEAFEIQAGGEVTDWLEQSKERTEDEEAPVTEDADPESKRWGVTDWLSRLENPPQPPLIRGEQHPPQPPLERGEQEAEPESLPDEQSVDELPSEESVVPEWLSEMEGEDALDGMAPADLEEAAELENPPQPPLIRGEQHPPQPPLDRGEQPGEAAAPEEAEPEISRAEIPSWLASMRPVEDAAPPMAPQKATTPRVESAGPLIGFSGVLSAQPEVGQVPKPPTYSLKLQVSENQKSHADLLTEMLAQEGEAQAIPRPAMISPQHILRSAIALILMAAVLWPLITSSQDAPLPSFSPETAAVNQLINGLPDQAQVLLAFDYEPALTGEMEAAASPVVDHLMLRGAYLSLVSTSPLGPILAERFLSTTEAEHGYASGSQYINLGFIPGGPAGLLAFAASPGRVLPYTLEGNPAWGRGDQPALPPLQGVARLSDFDLVMVITDSPEAARTWVEQAQPFLEDEGAQTPLVMVTSAQAEPLVRPYYQPTSGQVRGLLSGLRDGGAYARLIGREGLPRKYWDAFGLGLWAAAGLIAVGGLVNMGLAVSSQRSAVSGQQSAISRKQ